MTTATKMKLAGKGIRSLAGTGYSAGKLVRATKAGGRGNRRSAELTTAPARAVPVVGGLAAGAAVGAASAYYLDPESGKRRRHVTRDKVLKHARRGAAETRRKADYASGAAVGAVNARTPSPRDPEHDLNDPALANKVESEIFRDSETPKGKVNVNAENGVVYLRGEVASPGESQALAEAARGVTGVTAVESLLHVEGEPARAKGGEAKQPSPR
jgi:hypothetical protein